MGFALMGSGTWAKKAQEVTLASGAGYVLPAGQYIVNTGYYSVVQFWDALTGIWRILSAPIADGGVLITSDGSNVRLFNPTGSVAGVYLTNGGSGYTNGIYPAGTAQTGTYVVATASAGNATFGVVVGGAINTTVTVTTAGVGYNNPPTLVASLPPNGGIQATATTTVTGGGLGTVTVTNQGAGYTSAPTWTVVPHLADTITTPAVLTSTLTSSGRVTALTLGANAGNLYTSTPTISFAASAGSSAAATAVMCYTVTGVSSPTGGSANQTAATIQLSSAVIASAKTNAPVNPSTELPFLPRWGWAGTTLSSGVATAITVLDGGLHQSSTVTITTTSAWATAAPTSSATGTVAVGGVTDTSYLIAL